MGLGFKNNTLAQQEALINEVKGALFEYLVAEFIARDFQFEEGFLSGIGPVFREKLSEYEVLLRNVDLELLHRLPKIAKTTAKMIIEKLEIESISGISLQGRSKDVLTKETDILISTKDLKIPISLKLCKSNSFVNTKSGGVKSFFLKYFDTINEASIIQEEVNRKIDHSFNHMAYDLYQMNDLEYTGGFCLNWETAGLPSLPGELPELMRKRVLDCYYQIISAFYQAFMELHELSPEKFKHSLMPILGIGKEGIVQVTCFHEKVNQEKYHIEKISIFESQKVAKEINDFVILPLKEGISSFEIKFLHRRLQIRIKPMNSFTVPSYKVNCSVKEDRK